VFIDMLSFERRDRHEPIWFPYAQFTRTFLLPLLAYKYYGYHLRQVFTTRRDGLEHDEVYRLSRPLQRLRPLFFSLVSMPSWLSSRRDPDDRTIYERRKLSNPEQAKFVLETTLRRLQKTLNKLSPPQGLSSAWSDYTVSNNNYSSLQASVKEHFVHDTLKEFRPRRVLDVGCNTGQFSAIAARLGAGVVAIDYDPVVVGDVWRKSRAEGLNILPLLELAADLTRDIAIIEFIAPADSMFRRITCGRDHLHADLTEEAFENAAAPWFDVVRKHPIEGSSRTLYVLRRKP
jgi:hypothetical protein